MNNPWLLIAIFGTGVAVFGLAAWVCYGLVRRETGTWRLLAGVLMAVSGVCALLSGVCGLIGAIR